MLALSRQGLRQLRLDSRDDNPCARGGYRLREASQARKVVILASGSEVALAVDAADALEAEGVGVDVVSMVSTELFDEQADEYRDDLLPDDCLIVSLEAASTFGWERYTSNRAFPRGLTLGLDRFGASAPARDLFDHFGFTAENVVSRIKEKLNG